MWAPSILVSPAALWKINSYFTIQQQKELRFLEWPLTHAIRRHPGAHMIPSLQSLDSAFGIWGFASALLPFCTSTSAISSTNPYCSTSIFSALRIPASSVFHHLAEITNLLCYSQSALSPAEKKFSGLASAIRGCGFSLSFLLIDCMLYWMCKFILQFHEKFFSEIPNFSSNSFLDFGASFKKIWSWLSHVESRW